MLRTRLPGSGQNLSCCIFLDWKGRMCCQEIVVSNLNIYIWLWSWQVGPSDPEPTPLVTRAPNTTAQIVTNHHWHTSDTFSSPYYDFIPTNEFSNHWQQMWRSRPPACVKAVHILKRFLIEWFRIDNMSSEQWVRTLHGEHVCSTVNTLHSS